MRVTTIAVLALSLGASAALAQEPAASKNDIKSLAGPAGGAGTFSSTLQHGMKADVRPLKAGSGQTAALKSGGGGDATPQGVREATRSSSVKTQGRQSFAAAGQSSHSSFGLRSSGGTGGLASPDSVKQPDAVQKLR